MDTWAQAMPLRPDPCGGRKQRQEQSREVTGRWREAASAEETGGVAGGGR